MEFKLERRERLLVLAWFLAMFSHGFAGDDPMMFNLAAVLALASGFVFASALWRR